MTFSKEKYAMTLFVRKLQLFINSYPSMLVKQSEPNTNQSSVKILLRILILFIINNQLMILIIPTSKSSFTSSVVRMQL